MAKPKEEIVSKSYETIIDDLYYYLANLSRPELERFLTDLLTESEVRMMHRRWHIATLLNSGMDFRNTAEMAEVSTGTVMHVKKMLISSNGALPMALSKKREKDLQEVEDSKQTLA